MSSLPPSSFTTKLTLLSIRSIYQTHLHHHYQRYTLETSLFIIQLFIVIFIFIFIIFIVASHGSSSFSGCSVVIVRTSYSSYSCSIGFLIKHRIKFLLHSSNVRLRCDCHRWRIWWFGSCQRGMGHLIARNTYTHTHTLSLSCCYSRHALMTGCARRSQSSVVRLCQAIDSRNHVGSWWYMRQCMSCALITTMRARS
jgi:hypothetical protein